MYGKKDTLNYYTVGYMWGTLGILFNPELVVERNEELLMADEVYSKLSHDEQVVR